MSDEEATLVVTAGTAMYGLTELGGLVAGESVVVTGPGPIGLLGVAVAKALGAHPVILTGTRDNRLKIGLELGADHVVNARKENAVEAVRKLNGGKGVDYVVECSGAPNAVNEAIRMVNRGGKVCLAAFPHEETPVDVAHIVRNNIYLFGIRGEGKSATHRAEAFMSQKRFDATKVHTHTFPLEDLPTAIKYARERIDDAIKVVVKTRGTRGAAGRGGVDRGIARSRRVRMWYLRSNRSPGGTHENDRCSARRPARWPFRPRAQTYPVAPDHRRGPLPGRRPERRRGAHRRRAHGQGARPDHGDRECRRRRRHDRLGARSRAPRPTATRCSPAAWARMSRRRCSRRTSNTTRCATSSRSASPRMRRPSLSRARIFPRRTCASSSPT